MYICAGDGRSVVWGGGGRWVGRRGEGRGRDVVLIWVGDLLSICTIFGYPDTEKIDNPRVLMSCCMLTSVFRKTQRIIYFRS